MVDIRAAATSILSPVIRGRSRRILPNTDDVGIVVGNAHRRQITIPRMRKWLAKAAVQFRIFRL